MATRKINRYSPVLLTKTEQEDYVKQLDNASPEFRAAIEALLGVDLSALNYGQKVKAYADFLEFGRGSSAIAAAARAVRDVQQLAEEQRTIKALTEELHETQRQLAQVQATERRRARRSA